MYWGTVPVTNITREFRMSQHTAEVKSMGVAHQSSLTVDPGA